MNYGLYLSTAGLQAQEARQSVITNNLANAETTGFKRDLADLRARANAVYEDPTMANYRLPVVSDQGGGVWAVNGGIDLTQGTIKQTGNPQDLALEGRGFFTVQGDKPGDVLLTRDGKFVLNDQGTLVMATGGRAVLSASGEPIKLNPALSLKISKKGEVTQANGLAGIQLGLKDVDDSRNIQKLGNNVMTANPKALKDLPAATTIRQGAVENSGVDPTYEMINMMEGMRAFEANAKMITYQDQTMQQLNQIGRVA